MQQLLPLLCMLACPVGMGLMWLMNRPKKEKAIQDPLHSSSAYQPANLPEASSDKRERLALLKTRLSLLEVQQSNMVQQMELLSDESAVETRPVKPEKPVPAVQEQPEVLSH